MSVALRDELADVSRESVEQAVAIMGGREMSSRGQKARKAFAVIKAVVSPSFWRKVRANRQAVRANQPKPYSPAELIGEAFEIGNDLHDTLRGKRK